MNLSAQHSSNVVDRLFLCLAQKVVKTIMHSLRCRLRGSTTNRAIKLDSYRVKQHRSPITLYNWRSFATVGSGASVNCMLRRRRTTHVSTYLAAEQDLKK
jgi:hypothetical protein